MWRSVKDVQATDDYKLILLFDNLEKRCLNVSQFFSYGRFSELIDINKFKKVHIRFDTVEWDNGLDLDPEFIYNKSEKIN